METREGVTHALVQAADGDLSWVKELISKGADVNGMPLIMAIQCGELEIVKSLIEAGSDTELDFSGTTPLIRASGSGKPAKGYPDIVKYLISRGVSVNKISQDGNTALKIAKERENQEIVQMLIKAGATE